MNEEVICFELTFTELRVSQTQCKPTLIVAWVATMYHCPSMILNHISLYLWPSYLLRRLYAFLQGKRVFNPENPLSLQNGVQPLYAPVELFTENQDKMIQLCRA